MSLGLGVPDLGNKTRMVWLWVCVWSSVPILAQATPPSPIPPPVPAHTQSLPPDTDLTQLSQEEYQLLLGELKKQHQLGLGGGAILAFLGMGSLTTMAYHSRPQHACAITVLEKFRLGSAGILATTGGLFMVRYTQYSYNQNKVFLVNLTPEISAHPPPLIDSPYQLFRELWDHPTPTAGSISDQRAKLLHILRQQMSKSTF